MRLLTKNAGRMHTVAAVMTLALTVGATNLARAGSQNTLFRADTQRTGRTNYVATCSPSHTWVYETGSTCSTSPVVGIDGSVYFAPYDKYLYSVMDNGMLEWRTKINSIVVGSAAVSESGNIYAGTLSGSLFALDSNGQSLWKSPFSAGAGGISGSPLIGCDGSIYFGTQDNWLYALDPSGALKWKFQAGGPLSHALSESPDGAVIYAPSDDGLLYAINADGSKKWASQAISPSNNCAVGDDGTIYAGSNDGSLYALNPDGGLLWKFTTMGKITTAPAIAHDGTVYFGCQDSNLYALNPDGSLKWTHRSYSSIYSSPVIDRLGTVLYGSWNGKLTALNPSTGAVNWSKALSDKFYTSPTIGPDGSVYIIDSHGNLFGVGGPIPASVPEPSSVLALAGALAVLLGRRRLAK